MLEKDFDQLSMKEKYVLQKIMKKQRNGQSLTDVENRLFEKHHQRWADEESKVKSKKPIIIGLIVGALFIAFRNCQ